jgi:hypothetical protein
VGMERRGKRNMKIQNYLIYLGTEAVLRHYYKFFDILAINN